MQYRNHQTFGRSTRRIYLNSYLARFSYDWARFMCSQRPRALRRFIGFCRRLGRRFLGIGWSISLSQHFKKGGLDYPLTVGRHADVVAIETSRVLVFSANFWERCLSFSWPAPAFLTMTVIAGPIVSQRCSLHCVMANNYKNYKNS